MKGVSIDFEKVVGLGSCGMMMVWLMMGVMVKIFWKLWGGPYKRSHRGALTSPIKSARGIKSRILRCGAQWELNDRPAYRNLRQSCLIRYLDQ